MLRFPVPVICVSTGVFIADTDTLYKPVLLDTYKNKPFNDTSKSRGVPLEVHCVLTVVKSDILICVRKALEALVPSKT
jgi:hypothetical protein